MLQRLWRALTKPVGIKPMAAVPSVAVFVTADEIFVISPQMTDHGRVSVQPMQQFEANSAPNAVGEAVLQSLAAFHEIDGLPDPDHLQGLLGFVGARSWRAFAKRAINISVEGMSKDCVTLAAARANDPGAYAYGPSRECRREPLAIGKLLLQLARE